MWICGILHTRRKVWLLMEMQEEDTRRGNCRLPVETWTREKFARENDSPSLSVEDGHVYTDGRRFRDG